MKEVELHRFAGPFEHIPFREYVQNPAGLVAKANGQTRLIFHLSYDFHDYKSINHYTPKEQCLVKYRDFDQAVRLCTNAGRGAYMAKSDMKSAFRHLPIRPIDRKWLVMKANNPWMGNNTLWKSV